MYCKFCGNELANENAVICLKCGSPVDGKRVKAATSLSDKDNVISIISLILAITALSVWHAIYFTRGVFFMYDWSFWLTFSLTTFGACCGLVLGILSKYKLGYCLNTAAFTISIMTMLSVVIR